MTILVTGSTGLVGVRLLPRLMKAGEACRALVRPGKSAPPGVERVEGDLTDQGVLEAAVAGVSAIVHLAAVFRTTDEKLIWRSNLDGTRNLIAATKARAPQARFIMASTSNVYGATGARPGREDDVVDPKQAYPASKLAAESALRDSGLVWSILRFAFVYGDADGHIESMPKLVSEGRVKFHPAARMSMVHHRDIANAVSLALAGRLDRQIVNVADDAPTAMYELFGLVGSEMQPSAEPLQNPWHLHVDTTLSRKLGFNPEVRTVFQAAQEGAL